MKAAIDAVRFVVELAALAAVCYWGFHDHPNWAAKIALGIGAPLLMAAVWAIWMAPQSRRRAAESVRVLIELAIFGSAVAALAISTGAPLAIGFGVVAMVNAIVDHLLARQPASS